MKQFDIIGLDGSGKTCYLYAMAETMRQGLYGLSFHSNCDGWQKIIAELQWPSGTCKTSFFDFQCFYNSKHIDWLDFSCIDYRGGIIVSYNEVDRLLRSKFRKRIIDTDGLIILVAADMLKGILMGDFEARDDIDMLNYTISGVGQKLSQIPIAIAITKSDYFNNDENKVMFPLVKQLFPFIFNAALHLNTLIVPVSLGRNLSNNSCSSESVLYNNPSDGNIHIPILFNLYHILDNLIKTSISFKDIADLTSIKSTIKKELVAFANNNIIELNTI